MPSKVAGSLGVGGRVRAGAGLVRAREVGERQVVRVHVLAGRDGLRGVADDLVVAAHRLAGGDRRVAILWPGGTRPAMVMPSSAITVPPSSWRRAMTTLSAGGCGWWGCSWLMSLIQCGVARRRGARSRPSASRCPGPACRARRRGRPRSAIRLDGHGVELRDVLDPATRSAPRRSGYTCSSIRKCGATARLRHSARCATFSHGVMPPMRATSTCRIEAAPCCT